MTSRKHPSVTFWITVALVVVLVAYPLSFGLACWIRTRTPESRIWDTADVLYSPILVVWSKTCADWPGRSIAWYANLGSAPGRGAVIGNSDETNYVAIYEY